MSADERPTAGEFQNSLVVGVGGPVIPADIDSYKELRAADDRSRKLTTILTAWTQQQDQDRALRKTYGKWLLVALFVQTFLINLAFVLIGAKVLVVDQWVAQTFIVSVFAEIAAMVVIIVKYLFPDKSDAIVNILEKL